MRTPVRPHLLLALLVALVTFGSAEPASATEKLSYNYGSALYFQSDDLKGVSVMTSGQVRETVRLTLDYRHADVDTETPGFDLTTRALFGGAGYMFRQLDKADFIIDVGAYFADVELETPIGDTSNQDAGAFIGVRARILAARKLEVEPFVRYINSLESGADSSVFDFGIEGRFYISKNVALHASVEESDFYDQTMFGLGIRFGQQRDRFNF